jgi:hypothetical protein
MAIYLERNIECLLNNTSRFSARMLRKIPSCRQDPPRAAGLKPSLKKRAGKRASGYSLP